MKIAIDARIISSSTGRYVERLLHYLEDLDHENDYFILVLKKDAGYYKPANPKFKIIEADFPAYSFSEQLGLASLLYKLRVDLVHFTMPQQPLLYFGKRVTTVHDLTLVRYENVDMNPLAYKLRKLLFIILLKNVILRSKAVFTPTEFVRNDVIKFSSKRYAQKIVTTLEGWDQLAEKSEPVKQLIGKRFLAVIGNAFPYKNFDLVVDALAELKDDYPSLYLGMAGKKDIFYDRVYEHAVTKDVEDRVKILGFVSEGEKRWMLQNAEAYVVPSLSEGFHIPGLEAMTEGCPVLSSNATCLPEVYGNAALYFNPNNKKDLAEKIENIMKDSKLRHDLIIKGHERLKNFSWKRMAQQTLDIYKKSI